MALETWLPLNGTLKNQGLSETSVTTSSTAQYVTGGKIGKAIVLDSSSYLSFKYTGNQTQNFSISFWINIRSEMANTTENSVLMRFQSIVPDGTTTTQMNIIMWMNYHQIKFFSNQPQFAWVDPDYDKWVLFTVTSEVYGSNGCTVKLYKNGTLIGTTKKDSQFTLVNNSQFTIGYATSVGQFYLNDFRVYSHTLSPKEVSLLLQSMVCHITMGNVDGKIGGRNLILNGKGDKKAGFFKGFPTVTDEYGEVTLKSKKKYSDINIAYGFLLGCRDYTVGERVTWSYDIMYTAWNFPTGTNRAEFWIGQRYTNAPSGQTGTGFWRSVTRHDLPVVGVNGCELNKWYHVEKTMTIPEQASSNVGTQTIMSFYNSNADVEASFTAKFKNVKLERGNIATPWTPAPEDNSSLYDNTIYDTSGYCNNGTITDSTCPSWSSDSPRYRGCYKFDTTKYIKIDLQDTSGFSNSYSFSWWGNARAINSKMFWGFGDGNRLNLYCGWLCNTGDGESNPFYTPGTTTNVNIPSVNVWHHYVMTGDGTTVKYYLDGALYGIAKTYKPITGKTIYINGWNTATEYKIDGCISDFRIYATALSSDDVKELYDSVTSISNTGVLATHEFVEEEI